MPNKKFIGVKENNNEQLLLNRIDATKDFFFFFLEREREFQRMASEMLPRF